MRWSLAALLIGFGLDLLLGDPRGVPIRWRSSGN